MNTHNTHKDVAIIKEKEHIIFFFFKIWPLRMFTIDYFYESKCSPFMHLKYYQQET